jgi:excisionase family DNA binding protein
MLTPQEAAEQTGVSQRTVFRWIDEGVIHFADTAEGIFVCLVPLTVDAG